MHISEDELLQKYIPFDKPVPYKDLLIYPIKLQYIYDVQEMLNILQIDKNNLGYIEFISMSKLRFILTIIYNEQQYEHELYNLLSNALHIKDGHIINIYMDDTSEYLMIGEKIKEVYGHNIINEKTAITISAEDFDEIMRIVLYQNIVDYSDKYIDPDVKRAYEEYQRLKNKNAIKVSLEHKINCVQFKTGMTRETIGNLTIRNFVQLFEILVDESDYTAAKTAEFNGVKFKAPVEHWAYKAQKNKYADAFCDADAFVDKVQSV